jgi:hypothetical protein
LDKDELGRKENPKSKGMKEMAGLWIPWDVELGAVSISNREDPNPALEAFQNPTSNAAPSKNIWMKWTVKNNYPSREPCLEKL